MDLDERTHIPFGLPAWPQPQPGHPVTVDLVNPARRLTLGAALFALTAAAFIAGASSMPHPDRGILGFIAIVLFGFAAAVQIVALRYLGQSELKLVLDQDGVSAPHVNLFTAGSRRVPWSEVASTELLLVNQDLVGKITAKAGQTLRVHQTQLPTGWDVRDLMFRVEARALLARLGALSPATAAATEALVLSGRRGAVWVVGTPDGPIVEALLDPDRNELLLRGASLDTTRGELLVPMDPRQPPDATSLDR